MSETFNGCHKITSERYIQLVAEAPSRFGGLFNLPAFLGKAAFAALIFLVAGSQTVSAEFRVATVDVNRVLNESKEAGARKQELQTASEKARTRIEAKRNSLKEREAKLKAGKISESSKEAEAFRTEARDFNRLVKDTEEDLRKQFMKLNKDLTDKVLAQIRRYAETNDIQMVSDKSEKMRGPVLYGTSSFDITDEIIRSGR